MHVLNLPALHVFPHTHTPSLREGSGKQLWRQSPEANTIWT